MRPHWGGCLSASASHGKRRGQAIPKKTWPKQRPLKGAPALLKNIQYTHKDKRLRLVFQSLSPRRRGMRRASVRKAAFATSGGSAASGRRGFATSASPSPTSSL